MAYSAIKATSDRQMGIPIHITVFSHDIFIPHLNCYPYRVQIIQYPKQQDNQPGTALAEVSRVILEALGDHSLCCFVATLSKYKKITILPDIFISCWFAVGFFFFGGWGGGGGGASLLKKFLFLYISLLLLFIILKYLHFYRIFAS